MRSVLGSDHCKNPSWGQWACAIHMRLGCYLDRLSSTQEQPSSGLVTHTPRVDALPQDVTTSDRWLNAFWELESFGVLNSEHFVYDKFQETVQFKDGRYEVALPWKDSHPPLPNNYQLSMNHFNELLRCFQQARISYMNMIVIKTHIQQGIEHPEQTDAEIVVHYLPHHAILLGETRTPPN